MSTIESTELDLNVIPHCYMVLGIGATRQEVMDLKDELALYDNLVGIVSDYGESTVRLTSNDYKELMDVEDSMIIFEKIFEKDCFNLMSPIIEMNGSNNVVGNLADMIEFSSSYLGKTKMEETEFNEFVTTQLLVKDTLPVETFFATFLITKGYINIKYKKPKEVSDFMNRINNDIKFLKHLFCNFKDCNTKSFDILLHGDHAKFDIKKDLLKLYDLNKKLKIRVPKNCSRRNLREIKNKRIEAISTEDWTTAISPKKVNLNEGKSSTISSEASNFDFNGLSETDQQIAILTDKFGKIAPKTEKLFKFNQNSTPDIALNNFTVSLNYGKYAEEVLKKDKNAKVNPSEFYKQLKVVPTDKINNTSKLIDISVAETRFHNLVSMLPNNRLFMVALKEYRFTLKMRAQPKPIYAGTMFTVNTNGQEEKVTMLTLINALTEEESKCLLETSVILSYALCQHPFSNFKLPFETDLWDIRSFTNSDNLAVTPKFLSSFIEIITGKVKIKTAEGVSLSKEVGELVRSLAERQFRSLLTIKKSDWNTFINHIDTFRGKIAQTSRSYFSLR